MIFKQDRGVGRYICFVVIKELLTTFLVYTTITRSPGWYAVNEGTWYTFLAFSSVDHAMIFTSELRCIAFLCQCGVTFCISYTRVSLVMKKFVEKAEFAFCLVLNLKKIRLLELLGYVMKVLTFDYWIKGFCNQLFQLSLWKSDLN